MKVEQVRLEPLRQRLKRFALATFTDRFVKRQRVYRVTIDGKPLKRLIFAGSERPLRIGAALQALDGTGIFPRLYAQYDNELWVGYLEGTPVRRSDPNVLEDFADLISVLYKTGSQEVPSNETNFRRAFDTDLELLRETQLLDAGLADECAAVFASFAPERIWTGFDYGDALLKNLLRCDDGKIRFIDVESIRTDAALGTGIAKSLLRWVGDDRTEFLDNLESRGAAPFRPYLAAIELSFLAAWTKRSLLQRKNSLVGAEPFREIVARCNRAGA
jgi:hypothetical protein